MYSFKHKPELSSNLGNIRPRYLHIRPPFIDPVLHPFQHLPRYLFVRADRYETEHGHRGIVLPVNLGTGNIEAVSGPTENAFDDAAFFFEGMGRERQVNFEAKDKHRLWSRAYLRHGYIFTAITAISFIG